MNLSKNLGNYSTGYETDAGRTSIRTDVRPLLQRRHITLPLISSRSFLKIK